MQSSLDLGLEPPVPARFQEKESKSQDNDVEFTIQLQSDSGIADSTIENNDAYTPNTSDSVAQLQNQQSQISQIKQPKPTIYRIGDTDLFGCENQGSFMDKEAVCKFL